MAKKPTQPVQAPKTQSLTGAFMDCLIQPLLAVATVFRTANKLAGMAENRVDLLSAEQEVLLKDLNSTKDQRMAAKAAARNAADPYHI